MRRIFDYNEGKIANDDPNEIMPIS